MRFCCRLRLLEESASFDLRLRRKPKLYSLWRVLRPVILVSSYLGIVLSVFWAETLPLQLVWLYVNPHKKMNWAIALADILMIAAACIALTMKLSRRFRDKCLDIDLIVLLSGSAVALFFAFMSVIHPISHR